MCYDHDQYYINQRYHCRMSITSFPNQGTMPFPERNQYPDSGSKSEDCLIFLKKWKKSPLRSGVGALVICQPQPRQWNRSSCSWLFGGEQCRLPSFPDTNCLRPLRPSSPSSTSTIHSMCWELRAEPSAPWVLLLLLQACSLVSFLY